MMRRIQKIDRFVFLAFIIKSSRLRAILDLKFPGVFSTFFFRYLTTVNELLIQVSFLIHDYQQYQVPTTFALSTHLMIQWESAAEKQTWNTEVLFLRLLSYIRFPYFGLSQPFLKKSKNMLVSARLSLLEFVLARLGHICSPVKLHSRDRDVIHATKNRL